MSKPRVLVIDDEPAIRFGIRDFLEVHGFEVIEAETAQQGEHVFQARRPDVTIVDHLLPDGDAMTLLPRLKNIDVRAALVILTAHASIELAVRAIKEGAEHFLTKPVELPSLLVILQRLLEQQRTRRRQVAGHSREMRERVNPFAGTSRAIQALADETKLLLPSDSPILIQGDTGTGKGVLARWLHSHGPRAEEAFVNVNCAGLGRELLDSELFGHERGAFTGAVTNKVGLLEVADRGTLFLGEIGDLPLEVQPKLLKVLEEQQFRRVGDVRDRQVDVRLIAATHQNLRNLVQERRFRSDLFFRISSLPLRVPALRERAEDIPVLAAQFVEQLGQELGREPLGLGDDAMRALQEYSWPGNIRELRNVLERAVLLTRGDVLHRHDVRFETLPAGITPGYDGSLTLAQLEQQHIRRVLEEERGHVERAAKRLGIPRSTLYQRLKHYGIGSS
jgi:DNA-binding NtrC family response regulator